MSANKDKFIFLYSLYNQLIMYANPDLPSTRERILALLRENKTVTVAGLSHAWGLTRAGIRYHLNLLVKEGLAEIIPCDPNQRVSRGRPALRYRLTTQISSNNLLALCSALLEVYIESLPAEEREQALRLTAQYMAGEIADTDSPTQHMNQVINTLNRHAYQARWEASPVGPRIILRNCPYAVILKQHPALCQFDRLFLEQLSHLPLTQVARMDLETGSPPACVFICADSQQSQLY